MGCTATPAPRSLTVPVCGAGVVAVHRLGCREVREQPHNPVERIWAALVAYLANTAVDWHDRIHRARVLADDGPDLTWPPQPHGSSPWLLPPSYMQIVRRRLSVGVAPDRPFVGRRSVGGARSAARSGRSAPPAQPQPTVRQPRSTATMESTRPGHGSMRPSRRRAPRAAHVGLRRPPGLRSRPVRSLSLRVSVSPLLSLIGDKATPCQV